MRSRASWRLTYFLGLVLLCVFAGVLALPGALGDPINPPALTGPKAVLIAVTLGGAILIPVATIVFGIARVTRQQRRRAQRPCPNCGYGARPSEDRCPACGTVVPAAERSAV